MDTAEEERERYLRRGRRAERKPCLRHCAGVNCYRGILIGLAVLAGGMEHVMVFDLLTAFIKVICSCC